MMKKRLFAFGLAGVMLMGMSMNVFAATEVTGTDENNAEINSTPQAIVEFQQPQSYTVSIPSGIKVLDITTGISIGEVTATKVNLINGNKLKVSVSTLPFNMVGEKGGKSVSMDFYNGSNKINEATTDVAIFTTNADDFSSPSKEANSIILEVKKGADVDKDKILADTYRGTVNYTISVTK